MQTVRKLLLAALTLLVSAPLFGQAINCASGFSLAQNPTACGMQGYSGAADFFSNENAVSGTAAIIAPTNGGHAGWGFIRQAKVNAQAFTATWTFVPNGGNLAFVVENQTNQDGSQFSAGAGGEGGFSQFAGCGNIAPNQVFAMQFDNYIPL